MSGALCIAQPWPGMARTIYGDHQRFVDTYFKAYPGKESAKGMQSALQYKHPEYFQQHFCSISLPARSWGWLEFGVLHVTSMQLLGSRWC